MTALEIRWAPPALLALGALIVKGIGPSVGLPLRAPLGEVVPYQIGSFQGRDMTLPGEELAVVGATSYLLRSYLASPASGSGFQAFVAYYDQQMQGKTIHSPKNCLPGSGWEALQSGTTAIHAATGVVTVNRYLIQKGSQQALVLYWYQGRGRIQANEYSVKWNLLRDAALRRRSEEALVRILVPITEGPAAALAVARQAGETVARSLDQALPS